jgi:hypothetical protein
LPLLFSSQPSRKHFLGPSFLLLKSTLSHLSSYTPIPEPIAIIAWVINILLLFMISFLNRFSTLYNHSNTIAPRTKKSQCSYLCAPLRGVF